MRFVPPAVSRKVARQVLLTQKHSPALLFGAGVVGMVGTVVLASRATLKLDEVLEEHQKKSFNIDEATAQLGSYTEKDRQHDVVVLKLQTATKIAKLYSPAFGVGVISIACLTGSHHILTTRNAALTAAVTTLTETFDKYRDRVIGEIGEEKEKEIYLAAEKFEVEDPETGKKVKGKYGTIEGRSKYARIFDAVNSKSWSRTPENNRFFINCQQNIANDILKSRGHIFLNEVYDMLGFARSPEGQAVGWVYNGDGDNYVDFGIFDGNTWDAMRFVCGDENSVILDFNVDGVVWDLIGKEGKRHGR